MTVLRIDDVDYPFDHLEPFYLSLPGKGLPLPGNEQEKGPLRVRVSLGLHTVSTGCVKGAENMVDENGKPRRLCPDRYAFSLNLREKLSTMILDDHFAWVSKDKNQSSNYAVIDADRLKITTLKRGMYYVVYFYIGYVGSPYVDVALNIVSCHQREVAPENFPRRYSLHVLLRKCLFSQKRCP